MRLSTEEKVLAACGIQSNTGSLANAGVALDLTAFMVENKLESRLERAVLTDYFSFAPRTIGYVTETLELRLSSGFVASTPTVVVTDSAGAVVASTYYTIDYENGIVMLSSDVFLVGSSLSVNYTAGFLYFNSQTKLLKGIPAWMENAGVLLAAKLILTNSAVIATKKAQAAMKDVATVLSDDVSRLLNQRLRPRHGKVWPDRTVVTVPAPPVP